MREYDFQQTGWAKINLALHITGRRPDGYHELESLVVFTEFGDQLTAQKSDDDQLTLSGPFASDLSKSSDNANPNLVLDTVVKFRARYPDILPQGLHFHLEKNLPIASGIGGGSADAAATLRILASYTGEKITPEQLSNLAVEIGADVPMCLNAKTSIVAGIGEKITPLQSMPPLYITLVNPLVALSTPAMFAALKRIDNPPLTNSGNGFDTVKSLGDWLSQTRNDLQPPAQATTPEIAQAVQSLASTKGIIQPRMSGSGATTFGLYATQSDAQAAAEKVKSDYPSWWVISTKVRV